MPKSLAMTVRDVSLFKIWWIQFNNIHSFHHSSFHHIICWKLMGVFKIVFSWINEKFPNIKDEDFQQVTINRTKKNKNWCSELKCATLKVFMNFLIVIEIDWMIDASLLVHCPLPWSARKTQFDFTKRVKFTNFY